MNSFLCKKVDRFADKSILLVRVVFGVSMIFHGWEKVSGGSVAWEKLGGMVFGELPLGLTLIFGTLGAFSEFIGGILVALGLFTRLACVFLCLTMLGALSYHVLSGDPVYKWLHAIEMLVVFFMFLCTGAKCCSIDKKLGCN